MGIKAFIGDDSSQGREFLESFLNSPEFTIETLRKIMPSRTSKKKKSELAKDIAIAFEEERLSPEQILLPYVKSSRKWLSFKLGKPKVTPEKHKAKLLLDKFGDDKWYGVIEDSQDESKYYIRTHKITDYDGNKIRWTVIAKICSDYIALSWNGFTLISANDTKVERQVSFACWKYIPKYFDEIESFCQAKWTKPNLHKLILDYMWDKYIGKDEYKWQHKRIRAESAGIALNAHSSGIKEINVEGLEALSSKLAQSAVIAARMTNNSEAQNLIEKAILRCLLKEWGTKSYEFSLDKKDIEQNDLNKKSRYNKLIKAHCYFGLKPNSSTQDSLQHLKCDCGGSTSVLKFLLGELESCSNENM